MSKRSHSPSPPTSPHHSKYTRSSTSPPPPPQNHQSQSQDITMPSASPLPSTNTLISTNISHNNITCTLPSCPVREHTNIESFESHYIKFHTNRCHDCGKNFPTARILECHIRENHDMFAVVGREKGEKIYACFVEDCPKICANPGKRRAHLIDKHYYHKNFNFFIVNDGIDRATSLLTTSPQRKSRTRVRRVSEVSNPPSINTTTGKENGRRRRRSGGDEVMDLDESTTIVEEKKELKLEKKKGVEAKKEEEEKKVVDEVMKDDKDTPKTNGEVKDTVKDEDTDMADLTSRMSAIRFVPPSVIRFGRRGGGSGFSKK